MENPLRTGVIVGLLTSLPLIALSYLANAVAGLPFIPFDLFDWLARVLPGGLITFGIDAMVVTLSALGLAVSETAKLAEQMMALGIIIILGALAGLVIAGWRQRDPQKTMQAGATIGLALFVVFLLAEVGLGITGNVLLVSLWLLLLAVGFGVVTAATLDRLAAVETRAEDRDETRRDLLLKLAGSSLGLALGAWGLGWLADNRSGAVVQESGAGQPLSDTLNTAGATPGSVESAPANIPPTPAGRIEPVPGTRAEITSNEEFYRIDINTRPPVIDGNNWQLEVAGLFQEPRTLTLADLMGYPAVTQPLTLSCISNRIAGDLIGASYWTGVRLSDVMEDLGLQPEAGALFIEAEDGFYETVVAEDMFDERTLLVYGMNGQTLPVEHGFPLRIFIPNRYGMKQPKWIVRIEAIEAWRPGYWVDRGWSREARPHTVSVIDTVATDLIEDGRLPLGGIAWAGDRGIQKVEVQVDGGEWVEAQLREPPLSSLTWVQWRYEWPAQSGRHTFTVRATDGAGELQTAERSDPHPDGATGYHSQTVTI
ncbi:MAG TPA: molybdopterin-dependent oxidoreductase [Candidatus Sulfomarinibacteraceae bacterium]|nr:molybdopterin-dependent oxidoreductase [Candidatus Sulfomarinibacteraceae bacterium]